MDKTNNGLVDSIIKRFTVAKTDRQSYEQLWRSCFDYSFPIRGTGFNDEIVSGSTVKHKNAKLYDSTLTDSARTQASAIISGLTPANAVWFGLEINADEVSDDAKRWLSSAAKTIWKNIHNSNFDAAAYEGMLDLMAAGWFAMYIDSDRNLGGFVFELWPLSSVYCSASQAGGAIDTVYRYFELTAEQISNTYDIKGLGADFEAALKNNPSKKHKIIQAIYPRSVGKKNSTAKNKPVASVHILEEGKKLLRESGYEEMPVVVPRWMIIPQSVYATGPVSEALPDAKTLNDIKRLELMNAELAISGMWLAKDDGVLNPSTIKIKPGGIITTNEMDSFKPLVSGVNFNISFAKCEQLQAAIRKIMLADQLQPQDGPAMTATEVNMRQQLIRQLLGPIYGRMQAEYLQPLVMRCFGIAMRAGILGEAPDDINGQIASIRYLNPLARAQKMEEVVAINNLMQSVMSLAQLEPTVVDNINLDVVVRYTGESLGAPNETIRPLEEVQALREQRAEMQRMQQEKAMQQQVAMTGANAAAQAAGQKQGEQADEQ